MAHLIDKDALVAEIDKRLHQLTDAAFDSMIGRNLIEIKDFLNTLEVKETEEKPASEDFEEIVKNLWNEINTGHEYSVIESYNVFYGLCLDIANWNKERMMSKAIEGRLCSTISGSEQNIVAPAGYGEYGKDGDKVKLVVVKEDWL